MENEIPRRLSTPGCSRDSAAVPGVRVALTGEPRGTTVDGVADELDVQGVLGVVPGRPGSVVEVATPAVHPLIGVGELRGPQDGALVMTVVAPAPNRTSSNSASRLRAASLRSNALRRVSIKTPPN